MTVESSKCLNCRHSAYLYPLSRFLRTIRYQISAFRLMPATPHKNHLATTTIGDEKRNKNKSGYKKAKISHGQRKRRRIASWTNGY